MSSRLKCYPKLKHWVNDKHKNCIKCTHLLKNRGEVCAGYGNMQSVIMFIGKNPGKPNYDIPHAIGCPFCGSPSGDLFHDMIKKIGLNYHKIYTTNITKCSSNDGFKNLEPKMSEVKNCRDYLEQEIQQLNPKIIVCVGKFASTHLPKHLVEVKFAKVFHIWHPGYPLRSSFKTIEDYYIQFKKIRLYLDEIQGNLKYKDITQF